MLPNQNPFASLLRSRKFWLAVVGLVQTLLFQFVPDFPDEVWLAIDALLAVVIASIAYEDGQAKQAGMHPTQLQPESEEMAPDNLMPPR